MDASGTGAERDPARETFPAASAYIAHLIAERPILADHRDDLYELAGMAASFGYEQCREDFREATVPVRFEHGAIGVAKLQVKEAEDFLAGLGLEDSRIE